MLVLMSGCRQSSPVEKDIFQYKTPYIGEAGTIGNIVYNLPGSENYQGMELETGAEPYGMILNYQDEDVTFENFKETMIYNATFIFALVENASWVTFDLADKDQQISREDIEELYGEDVSSYSNENELSAFIQETLEKEGTIDKFFEEK